MLIFVTRVQTQMFQGMDTKQPKMLSMRCTIRKSRAMYFSVFQPIRKDNLREKECRKTTLIKDANYL